MNTGGDFVLQHQIKLDLVRTRGCAIHCMELFYLSAGTLASALPLALREILAGLSNADVENNCVDPSFAFTP